MRGSLQKSESILRPQPTCTGERALRNRSSGPEQQGNSSTLSHVSQTLEPGRIPSARGSSTILQDGTSTQRSGSMQKRDSKVENLKREDSSARQRRKLRLRGLSSLSPGALSRFKDRCLLRFSETSLWVWKGSRQQM